MAQAMILQSNHGLFRGRALFEHPKFSDMEPQDYAHELTQNGLDSSEDRKMIELYDNHFNSIRSHHLESHFRGIQS